MKTKFKLILFALTAASLFGLAVFLRFAGLTQVPPAPYWEEAALGYDAYSIVLTGKDHHGTAWPIVAFESFGDWKPSGYFYAAAFAIKLFGLSVWSVRLPAVLAGCVFVGLVGLSGWLAQRYWQIGTSKLWLVMLGVAAISPWAILFSRAAWEVMLATTFSVAAVLSFWWFLSSWIKQSAWRWLALMFSLLLAALSMYTYHALRLVTPLLMFWTLVWWLGQSDKKVIWQIWLKQKTYTIALAGIGFAFIVVLLLPLLQNLQSPVIQQRFAETSVLNATAPIEQSNTARAAAGDTVLARIVYHRYWFELQLLAQQYLKHLNLNFLFVHGDSNPRHSSQYFGQLYYLDAVFILLGAVFLWRNHRKWAVYLLGWWLIATLPAAMTTAAPHALRSLPALPVWLWLISYGITEFTKKSVWLVLTVVVAYGISLAWFWSAYTLQYPKTYATEWQTGYCEMYQALVEAKNEQPNLPIYVTRTKGRPAMYYWFCQKIDPVSVQAAQTATKKDQSEFLSFEQLHFVTGVGEVPDQPAIVAIDAAESLQSKTKKLRYESPSWQIWQQ